MSTSSNWVVVIAVSSDWGVVIAHPAFPLKHDVYGSEYSYFAVQ
jgi:hypothetical protein